MPEDFKYDLFPSHSAKDKAVVRPLAERLRADRLRVWFDEWVLKPGDSIPAKIEERLEHSRVLSLAHQMGEGARRAGEGGLSAQAFGSAWAQLEAGTCGRRNLRFRDPLNQERRFLSALQPSAFSLQPFPDAPIKGSLAQFHCRNEAGLG